VTALGLVALAAWHATRQSATTAPVVDSLANGENGRVSFASRSADWRDFASSGPLGVAAVVTGRLVLPDNAAAPVPAAILLHGSDGPSEHQRRYAAVLADWGMASFLIDSFGPRGVKSTIGNQEAVSPYSMLTDAYAALALLATHPRIDPKRIVLIGWSKGGQVADWASRERYRRRLPKTNLRFAAHVAFYPWCGQQDFRIDLTGAPLLYLLGERDDWSGAQPCVDYVERLTKAGYRARAIVYANAEHGFDYSGQSRTHLAQAASWKDCVYFARNRGFVVARSGSFERWSRLDRYLRDCAETGAHVGTNASARDRALADLGEFLTPFLSR